MLTVHPSQQIEMMCRYVHRRQVHGRRGVVIGVQRRLRADFGSVMETDCVMHSVGLMRAGQSFDAQPISRCLEATCRQT